MLTFYFISVNRIPTTENNDNHSTGDSVTVSLASDNNNMNVNQVNLPLTTHNQTDYYGNCLISGSEIACSSNNSNSDTKTNNCNNNETQEMNNNVEINKITQEMLTIDDGGHVCDTCNKRFSTKYFLRKHRRLHTGTSIVKFRFEFVLRIVE